MVVASGFFAACAPIANAPNASMTFCHGEVARSRRQFVIAVEDGVVYLYGAYFPRARGRRSRATALRQQTDPLAPPLRRCGCWPPSEFGLGLVRPPRRRLRTDTGADPLWHRLGGGWPTSNFESGSGRTIDHAPPRRWCGRRRGRPHLRYAFQRNVTWLASSASKRLLVIATRWV